MSLGKQVEDLVFSIGELREGDGGGGGAGPGKELGWATAGPDMAPPAATSCTARTTSAWLVPLSR